MKRLAAPSVHVRQQRVNKIDWLTECWLLDWVWWSELTYSSDNHSVATGPPAAVSQLRSTSKVVFYVSRSPPLVSSVSVSPCCDLLRHLEGVCRYFWSRRCTGVVWAGWDIPLWSRVPSVVSGGWSCWSCPWSCFWRAGCRWRSCCSRCPSDGG